MKVVLIILIAVHGLMHVLGFVKAFKLAPINGLKPITSKLNGSLWLLTAILFLLAAAMFSMEKEWWWAISASGIIISQYLVINDWHDAKYGTIPNVIILIISVIGFLEWTLNKT